MKEIVTSIDIGSDSIKFVVGEYFDNRVNILHASYIKSKGIRKGLIIDSNLMVSAIRDGVKDVNEHLGFSIRNVIVNVPSYNTNFMYVTSEVDIEDAVSSSDVSNAIKESVYSKIENDYELVTVLPLTFILDGKKETKYPVNEKCSKMGFKGIMITVPKKNIYSVVSVIESAGLKVIDITVSGISDYYEIREKEYDRKVGAIINIGHEVTNVSVINKGILMNTEVLQIGSHNIEKDIAYIFGINVIDARDIKEKFAVAHKRFVTLTDIYDIKNNASEDIKLTQQEVTEVVMSRISEILSYAKKQILSLTNKEIEYVVITGGITQMKYFKNLVYEILGKDVIIYLMKDIGARDNRYTSALGSIKYYIEKMKIRGKSASLISEDDEEMLLTPESKSKRGFVDISKMFKWNAKNREEK